MISIPIRDASFGPWIVTFSPAKYSSPPSIVLIPATHLISVDFPAPLSPTRAMTSPSRTSKSTSVSAWTDPKCFEIPRSSSSGDPALVRSSVAVAVAVTRPPRSAGRGRRSAPAGCALAVLRVHPAADLALLEEAVLEQERVVPLRDRHRRQ